MLHPLRGRGSVRSPRSTRAPIDIPGFWLLLVLLVLDARTAFAVSPPIAGGALPPEVARAVTEGLARPSPRRDPHASLDGAIASPLIARTPVAGRWHLPVLCVDFPDRRATHSATGFQTLLFDTTGAVATGSMADYYSEVSNGALLVRGDVFGWETMPDTANFYGNDSYGAASLAFPQNDAGLVYAATARFDPTVDYAKYDRDGDGFVDALLIVHSGYGGEAASSDRSNLWSLYSQLNGDWGVIGAYTTQDPRPGHPGQFI